MVININRQGAVDSSVLITFLLHCSVKTGLLVYPAAPN